jgi:hypothetical protein
MDEQTLKKLTAQIKELYGDKGDWNQGGIDRAAELATLLLNQGVTDVSQIKIEGGQAIFGDKRIGFAGDYNNDDTYGSKASDQLQNGNIIGWSARGDGNVTYRIETDEQGNSYLTPEWGSSSDMKKVRNTLKAAAAIAAMYYGVPMLEEGALAALEAGEAAGSLTAGITPESIAAFEAALPAAAGEGLLTGASLTAGITPEAIAAAEAGLPVSEAAAPYVMSSADKAALYGSEAAYGPGMTGTQTAAYDTVLNATGSTTLANAAANLASTGLPVSDILKAIPSLLTVAATPGLFGGGGGGGGGNLVAPTQGVPTSSPDYYRSIQQYYNAYMPNAPRDVSGPLQQWYEGTYTPQTGQTQGSTGATQPNVSVPGRPTMRPLGAGNAAMQQTAAQQETRSPNQILFDEYIQRYDPSDGFAERGQQVLGLLSKQNPDLFAALTGDVTSFNAAYGGKYSSISSERQQALDQARIKKDQAWDLQQLLGLRSDIDFSDPTAVANAFSDLGQQAQLYLATGRSPESAGLLQSYAKPLRGAALAGDMAAGRISYDQAQALPIYDRRQAAIDQARRSLADYNASVQAGQRPEQAGYAENLQRIIDTNQAGMQEYASLLSGLDMGALDYNRLTNPQDILDFAQRAGVGTQASSLFAPTGG